MDGVTEVSQEVADAEMEAAFAATSNEGADKQVVEPSKTEVAAVEAEIPAEVVVVAEVAPVQSTLSEDQIKLLAAIPELESRLTQQADKVAGNYGELKRILETMQKEKATPQGAADSSAYVPTEGDYLDEEFREIAQGVQAKIDRAMAKLPVQVGTTEEQFESMYAARELAKRNEAINTLDAMHPDRIEVYATPEWTTYFAALPAYEQDSFNRSEDPFYVGREISKFKDHREKAVAQAEKSKQRIEKAITPVGVRPVGHSTVSDDEAAQKAFESQF